mmetsp:Transcript_12234/g.36712  ORF Transcript_12234/g.36712 Transcript_12234/m.36712 type:complete len:204 (-) Transcript_12234:817-1428(-)
MPAWHRRAVPRPALSPPCPPIHQAPLLPQTGQPRAAGMEPAAVPALRSAPRGVSPRKQRVASAAAQQLPCKMPSPAPPPAAGRPEAPASPHPALSLPAQTPRQNLYPRTAPQAPPPEQRRLTWRAATTGGPPAGEAGSPPVPPNQRSPRRHRPSPAAPSPSCPHGVLQGGAAALAPARMPQPPTAQPPAEPGSPWSSPLPGWR